jgi:hypothetical protein
VAERYLPPGAFIGPLLLPHYWFVLELGVLIGVIPWLLTWIGLLLFSPAHRPSSALGLLQGPWSLAMLALQWWAIVTLIFAIVERTQVRARGRKWTAAKLDGAKDPSHVSRAGAIFETVVGVVATLAWIDVLSIPAIPGLRITVRPVILQTFYWSVLAILLVSTALSALNAVRPWLTRRRAAARIAIHSASLLLVGLLLRSGLWVEVAIAGAHADKAAQVTAWANFSVFVTLASIGVSALVSTISEARRLARIPPVRPSAPAAAA